MKTISLWFCGFWSNFDKEDNFLVNILKEKYNINITDNNPDFLISSCQGSPFEWMKWDCPRIMFVGEPVPAEFYSIDYFIGYDYLTLQDRALRYPLFLCRNAHLQKFSNKTISDEEAYNILKSKKYFCNYIYGHGTINGKREKVLHELEKYKRVECAGSYLNNMPGGLSYNYQNKLEFMKQCKFSICVDSIKYPGFTTEKIAHGFDANTIPIYYGNPFVDEDFNEKSFVNCMKFSSIEQAIEEVIRIDQDDERYINMIQECRYNDALYEEKKYNELKNFLYNIFDQDKEAAYRRPRYYTSGLFETYLTDYCINKGPISKKKQLQLIHRIIKNRGL